MLRRAGLESGRPHRRTRHQTRHQIVSTGRGVPEEKAAYPLPPGMLGGLRQVLRAAVRGVYSPADSGFPEPGTDERQVRLLQAEARPHRFRSQRRDHRFRRVARARQGEQVEQSAGGARIRGPHPGHVEGDAAGRSEHRLEGGAVASEVRREHEHVGRLQVRTGVEESEEAVVQHLRLAKRGVADVDLDGVVRARRFSRPFPEILFHRLPREPQVQDVPLHRGELRRFLRGYEVFVGFRSGALRVDERIDHVASRPAPGREELVARAEVMFGGIDPRGPQPALAFRVDVAPVLRHGLRM